ncbi:MAG: glycosyltransferase [Candidatus Omnitrophica bacterium]|nr:glycosyltransferase [Candidatus Omnitrophota bacterium]
MRNLVSIIIPTKNRKGLLVQAIESCLVQTYAALEVVVVDDASDDGTEEAVRKFADSRIVYLKQSVSRGSVAAINRGFASAKGAYLTWSSDDDFYKPEAVAALVAVLDTEQDVDFVYAHYWMVDMDGKILNAARVEDPEGLSTDNYVGHCFLYRRKVYESIGDYHAEPFLAEEYEYWLRVRARFTMRRLAVPLYFHRIHPLTLTSVHGEERMQAGVARARQPFIPAWRHHFLVARWHYHRARRLKSLGHALLAACLRPWHVPTWRIMALDIFPAGFVAFLRSGRE